MIIRNRKARFNYDTIYTEVAGLMLKGTEIKSIKNGKASFSDSYCYFDGDELFVKNLVVSEYDNGNINNHNPYRDKKLLLTKQQLLKLKTRSSERGLTIVPTRLFIDDKGLAKLEIALAKGKNVSDKKRKILEEDIKKDMDREVKNYLTGYE